jgi:hypothetical protein
MSRYRCGDAGQVIVTSLPTVPMMWSSIQPGGYIERYELMIRFSIPPYQAGDGSCSRAGLTIQDAGSGQGS